MAGHVSIYPASGDACYCCNLSDAQAIAARKRYSCDEVKRRAVIESRVPTVQISASIISAIQCQEAVKLLMGQGANSSVRFSFDRRNLRADKFDLLANQQCGAIQFHDRIEFSPIVVSSRDSLACLFNKAEELVGSNPQLDLIQDRSLLASYCCKACGTKVEVCRPLHEVFEDELYCGGMACISMAPRSVVAHDVGLERVARFQTSDLRFMTCNLESLGIPDRHIVWLSGDGGSGYFRLGTAEIS